MVRHGKKGFSLVEMLVVISVIGLLAGLLMPAMVGARRHAHSLVCRSNLRQLALANLGYASESDGFFSLAAADMWDGAGGRHRWHGVRDCADEPFDPLRSPLAGYLSDGRVKQCPAARGFVQGRLWTDNFEQGCGGYGYNMTYLGSRLWQRALSMKEAYAASARMSEVSRPEATVMFADCAMSRSKGLYMEYSFAEPPFFLVQGRVFTDAYASPSIHFRHKEKANTAWADGHVEAMPMADVDGRNVYGIVSSGMNLGWFEPVDNSLFDLE
jgi:prepilin-type N-terminal cleavage/methylation domain-containing protein/prepilin-type processing-associated H-X9-DG protein